MFTIKYACKEDKDLWFSYDRHLSENEFLLKCRDKRGYIISDNEKPVGIMRYNLFWDTIPFLTLIYIDNAYQRRKFGSQAMLYWENEMSKLGYKMLMTSTQIDETAQHFYRELGYIDRGAIFLDSTPFEQAQEVILVKLL